MLSFFSALTGTVSAHPHFAYAAVLLLALSESIPIIGAVVPGTAIIVGIAALIPNGVVGLWPLLFAACLGAILGDGLSFWLGYRYHHDILQRWPLNRYPDLLARSETFFQRHGGKSVVLARFTPGVRAFVPLVAGMLKMPIQRFYAANILSALVWAPVHILPGMVVGTVFHTAGAAAGRLAVLAVVVAILLWATVWVVRCALRHGIPVVAAETERLRAWTGARDTWLARQVHSLLDPSRRETKALVVMGLVLTGATWLFFGILEDVVTGDPLVRTDVAVHGLLQDLRTPWGDAVMIGFTELGDTAVTLPVGVGVFLWLLWKRAWRTAAYWAAAVGCASALNTAIKVVLHRARPTEGLYSGWSDFSFPSGHSTVNAAMYGFLVVLLARRLSPAARSTAVIAAAVFVALIAFSRVYLGAHWFSDVVGGLAFAAAWVSLLGIGYQHHQAMVKEPKGVLVVAFSLLVVAGAYNVRLHHASDVERYAVRDDPATMAEMAWWTGDWQQLPARRIDFEGEAEEPITFQWAGSLSRLKSELLARAWQAPATWSLAGTLAWFAPSTDPMMLPAMPSFERGEGPDLTLILPWQDGGGVPSRLVLRIWPAEVDLRNAHSTPLWIGSVVEEQLQRHLSFFTLAHVKADANSGRDQLADAVKSGRLVSRSDKSSSTGWDGQVLLGRDVDLF